MGFEALLIIYIYIRQFKGRTVSHLYLRTRKNKQVLNGRMDGNGDDSNHFPMIHPGNFDVKPLKIGRAPKGNSSEPNHHFSGAMLNFGGVMI